MSANRRSDALKLLGGVGLVANHNQKWPGSATGPRSAHDAAGKTGSISGSSSTVTGVDLIAKWRRSVIAA